MAGALLLATGVAGSMVTWTADMPTVLAMRRSDFVILSFISLGTLPLATLVGSAVPGLGPILAASRHFEAANATFNPGLREHHLHWGTVAVASGIAQAAGVALMITGGIASATEAPQPVTASLLFTGDGLSVQGRF